MLKRKEISPDEALDAIKENKRDSQQHKCSSYACEKRARHQQKTRYFKKRSPGISMDYQ